MSRDKQDPSNRIACQICGGISEQTNHMGLCPACDWDDAWSDLCDAVYNDKVRTEIPASDLNDLRKRVTDILDMLDENESCGDSSEAMACNIADLIAEATTYMRSELLIECDPEKLREHAAQYRP